MPDRQSSSFLSRLFKPNHVNGHAGTAAGQPNVRSAREHLLLTRAGEFADVRLKDIMIPRANITAIEESTPLSVLMEVFADAQHSRLPVFRETLDDPTGYVHIKDIMGLLVKENAQPDDAVLPQLRRDILYVPASMSASDLLLRMQTTHLHIALVVDEFGGTDGLVTLEDLVEQVFGEISDEHDEDPDINVLSPNSFEADARADIDDVEKLIGHTFLTEDMDQETGSIGGLVFVLAGRVPRRGEVIAHPNGYEFEIVDADPRKIKRIRAKRVKKSAATQQAAAS